MPKKQPDPECHIPWDHEPHAFTVHIDGDLVGEHECPGKGDDAAAG